MKDLKNLKTKVLRARLTQENWDSLKFLAKEDNRTVTGWLENKIGQEMAVYGINKKCPKPY